MWKQCVDVRRRVPRAWAGRASLCTCDNVLYVVDVYRSERACVGSVLPVEDT